VNGLKSIGKGIAILGIWIGGALAIVGFASITTLTVPTELPSGVAVHPDISMTIIDDILQIIRSLYRFNFVLSIIALTLAFLATLLILYRWDKTPPPHEEG